MLDIEEFSLAAWATPNCAQFNAMTKRGIRYMGWGHIGNSERFFPNELKRKEVASDWGRRGRTYGT